MPVVFRFHNDKERDMYFLIKQEYIDMEIIPLLQTMLSNHVKFHEDYTRKELVEIVETIVEEYNGTLIPFTLFDIKYGG